MVGARGVPVRARDQPTRSLPGPVLNWAWSAGAQAFARRNVVKVARVGSIRHHGVGTPFSFSRQTDLQSCLDQVEERLRADPGLLVPAS